MQVGNTIKQLRNQKGLTQKDLADRLFMSAQAVSRWENNETEPDINAIKKLAEIFEVGVEVIINGIPEPEEPVVEETKVEETQPAEEPKEETPEENAVEVVDQPVAFGINAVVGNKQIGVCKKCGKPICEKDNYAKKKITVDGKETYEYTCSECFNKEIDYKNDVGKTKVAKKQKQIKFQRGDKKLIVWSIVIAVLFFGIALGICIWQYDVVGIGWTIGLPLIAAYCGAAEFYCLFSASWVCDVFGTIASWSIRLPGIIFTLDWEGIAFLIVMKIIFAIVGAVFGVCVFLLAVAVSTVFSVFTFIPLLIYNKYHYVD